MSEDAKITGTLAENGEIICKNCENLPWNLIVAVQHSPKIMLLYFVKHAEDCGNFPPEVKGDYQNIMECLNDRYAKFSEKRKSKIDKVCKNCVPERYVPPIIEQYYVEDPGDLIKKLNQNGASLTNDCSLENVREAYLIMNPKNKKDVCKYISRILENELGYFVISYGFPVGKDAYRKAVSDYDQHQQKDHFLYQKLDKSIRKRCHDL